MNRYDISLPFYLDQDRALYWQMDLGRTPDLVALRGVHVYATLEAVGGGRDAVGPGLFYLLINDWFFSNILLSSLSIYFLSLPPLSLFVSSSIALLFVLHFSTLFCFFFQTKICFQMVEISSLTRLVLSSIGAEQWHMSDPQCHSSLRPSSQTI